MFGFLFGFLFGGFGTLEVGLHGALRFGSLFVIGLGFVAVGFLDGFLGGFLFCEGGFLGGGFLGGGFLGGGFRGGGFLFPKT